MIVSISGVPGSGKTSAAKLLAERLGVPYYSVGGLRGKMALERGITIDALNKIGEAEAFTDKDADDYQRELGKKKSDFVIEGRLSWYFIPQSFKVLLLCDPHEAARRIFASRRSRTETGRSDEPEYADLEEAERTIAERTASDARRYLKYYGIDYRDPKHFDLVIDTSHSRGPEETAEQIERALPQTKKDRPSLAARRS